jgi:excisionase family DNA binding protein
MTESNEKILLNVQELSALTGISPGTLYHWASQGRIPCVRLSHRCLRFSLEAIREWLAGLNEPAGKQSL